MAAEGDVSQARKRKIANNENGETKRRRDDEDVDNSVDEEIVEEVCFFLLFIFLNEMYILLSSLGLFIFNFSNSFVSFSLLIFVLAF